MKKRILAVLFLCLIAAVFSACAKKNADADPSTPPAEPPAQNETQEAETAAKDDEAAPEAPDPEATAFSGVEALLEGVALAKDTDLKGRTEAQNILAGLDEVYAPDADFEDFELLGVEALEGYLVYYYMPTEGPAYDGFDYRRGISVTVCTDSSVTLEQVCDQMGLTPEADGFAYDAEHQQLFFSQDGYTCSLQMPEGTADPEAMKQYCKLRQFPVN